MIKQIFLLLVLTVSAGCRAEPQWGEGHYSLSQVDIHAAQDVQVKVIEATKKFGAKNGFKVDAGNNLPRDGRQVVQVLLTRTDGAAVVSSNFMDAGTLRTDFYAEKEGADWRAVKEAWLKEVRTVVGKDGNVVDVILEQMPTQIH